MSDSDEQTIAISGRLDSESVPARVRETNDWLTPDDELTLDLAGVERVDSAGVALLLDWLRSAHEKRTTLRFINAPAQMRAIVGFCGLDDVIPLDADAGPSSPAIETTPA